MIFAVIVLTYSKFQYSLKRKKENNIDKNSVDLLIKDNNYPTVLDRLVRSFHRFELSDCSNIDIPCKTDIECQQICLKPFTCDKNLHSCKDTQTTNECGQYGVLRNVYDINQKVYKNKCVCTSPLYSGPTCSEPTIYCDSVINDVCVCNEDKTLFTWRVDDEYSLDMCVPNIHYRLFTNQDRFNSSSRKHFDWFNYGLKIK